MQSRSHTVDKDTAIMATAEQNTAAATAAAGEIATNAVADIYQGGEYHDGVLVTPGKAPGKAAGAKPAAAAKPAAKPAAAAAAADDTDPDDDTGTETERTERHRSAQDRINKAVRGQRTAERENIALKARLDALETRVNGGTQQAAPPKPGTVKPDPTKYPLQDLDPQYIADLTEFAARQANAKIKDEDKTSAATKAENDRKAANAVKVDEFVGKGLDSYDDFDEVVVKDTSLPFRLPMVEMALDSEYGQQILYEAATDKKTLKLLSTLSPYRQVAWFSRREDELSSAAAQDAPEEGDVVAETPARRAAPVKASKAPAPIASARGSSGQSGNSATSDFRSFEAMAMGRK